MPVGELGVLLGEIELYVLGVFGFFVVFLPDVRLGYLDFVVLRKGFTGCDADGAAHARGEVRQRLNAGVVTRYWRLDSACRVCGQEYRCRGYRGQVGCVCRLVVGLQVQVGRCRVVVKKYGFSEAELSFRCASCALQGSFEFPVGQ